MTMNGKNSGPLAPPARHRMLLETRDGSETAVRYDSLAAVAFAACDEADPLSGIVATATCGKGANSRAAWSRSGRIACASRDRPEAS